MTGCDGELKIEREVDLGAIEVRNCAVSDEPFNPDDSIPLYATVENPEDVALYCEVVWFAQDIGGVNIAQSGEILVPSDYALNTNASFTPNDNDNVLDAVGEDAEWSSSLEAHVLPGSVRQSTAPSLGGLSGRSSAARAGGPAMTDGGCAACGDGARAASRLAVIDDPAGRTFATATAGIAAGVVGMALLG